MCDRHNTLHTSLPIRHLRVDDWTPGQVRDGRKKKMLLGEVTSSETEASKPTPKHPTERRLTILHAERAGVLKDILDIRTSRLGLEGVEEGGCCALHNPTDGLEIVGLDTVEIPTEP